MLQKIYVHAPEGHESLKPLIDINRVQGISSIAAPNADGSQVCVAFPLDSKIRFELEALLPGATVYPAPTDPAPLPDKHSGLLKEHGVTKGQTMRDAALQLYAKYHCSDGHPDS